MITYLDPFSRVLLSIAVIMAVVVVFLLLTRWLIDFTRELHHLNTEIMRTRGKEREYWLAERKRLWLSILPFIKY